MEYLAKRAWMNRPCRQRLATMLLAAGLGMITGVAMAKDPLPEPRSKPPMVVAQATRTPAPAPGQATNPPAAAATTVQPAATPPAAAGPQQTGPSGLPIPRFVSIKSAPVNIRRGPTREHEIIWTYQKVGIPVEIIQEFENWRRIRDADGEEGWVLQTLLSGRRTALITPLEKQKSKVTAVRQAAGGTSPIVAYLEPNVLANVSACKTGWCRISGDGFAGWVETKYLWGARPDESFD